MRCRQEGRLTVTAVARTIVSTGDVETAANVGATETKTSSMEETGEVRGDRVMGEILSSTLDSSLHTDNVSFEQSTSQAKTGKGL